MSYRLELALSNRAVCKNAECKKNNVKIDKNTLRLGVLVTYNEKQAFSWRHWGCVTPQQIENLNSVIEGDLDLLDGYEDIPEELQQKVSQALLDGHVDDADWNGDVEVNRPGKKGFRSPKKKPEKKNGDDDGGGSPSPKKRATKKRGRKKLDSGDELEEEEKPKRASKRGKKKATEEAECDHSTAEEPPTKKPKTNAKEARSSIKKEPEPSQDNDSDVKPMLKTIKKKSRVSRKSPAKREPAEEETESETESQSETVEEDSKPKPGRKKTNARTNQPEKRKGKVSGAKGTRSRTTRNQAGSP